MENQPVNIEENFQTILQNIKNASERRPQKLQHVKPQLMLATKTVTTEELIRTYNQGQRDFGENYVQELVEKSNSPDILENCKDIRWHLIGHLQSNKINKILAVPNLYLIQTVHSRTLAETLNHKWPDFCSDNTQLKIMLQVNTGGEDSKSGMSPDDVTETARYVMENCSNLKLTGLMTIGRYDYNPADGPNPDFLCLVKCRDEMCRALNLNWKEYELSMGMTSDYEQAVELGSTIVRVGTAVFGPRPITKSFHKFLMYGDEKTISNN